MLRVRHRADSGTAHRARVAAQSFGGYAVVTGAEAGRSCVGSNHCPNPVVPASPVHLCGKHIREVYAFASDMLESNWDGAVRDYVSELHDRFKPPQPVKQPRSGWVYFLRFGDRVKIGYTTNPDERLKAIPHEQVIAVVPGSRDDEAAWHELLADYRTVGEWFTAEPQVLAVLNKVAKSA